MSRSARRRVAEIHERRKQVASLLAEERQKCLNFADAFAAIGLVPTEVPSREIIPYYSQDTELLKEVVLLAPRAAIQAFYLDSATIKKRIECTYGVVADTRRRLVSCWRVRVQTGPGYLFTFLKEGDVEDVEGRPD